MQLLTANAIESPLRTVLKSQFLNCSQETDGRLLLHASHAASKGYETVVICSEDTDVFIMALAFHDKIAARLFQRGSQSQHAVAC